VVLPDHPSLLLLLLLLLLRRLPAGWLGCWQQLRLSCAAPHSAAQTGLQTG
jgi:hypothetical protein